MGMAALLGKARRSQGCVVRPPCGGLAVPEGMIVPGDVMEFYELCGGVNLYPSCEYASSIPAPTGVVESNIAILGERYPEDITSSWFTIAATQTGDYLSIDFSADRNGRCYDSFSEIHGIAGSCPVIAESFSDLFERLLESRGDYWYWLKSEFVGLGDAYDEP